MARLEADSERFRLARATGRLIEDLPLSEIATDSMIRDRLVMDEDDLTELINSIAAHGLRLPIEVFELSAPDSRGCRYGLVSGYRRYLAMERLHAMSGGDRFSTIRALVREPEHMGGAFVAMVEENEVRANLSPYERGRIAVIAAQNGAFANVEAAVDNLFATASKAKRSKIRSFAQVFEELGDLLLFPEFLSERQGLRLASGLRSGGGAMLRAALEGGRGNGPDEEWALLEPALSRLETRPRDARRGGRPRSVGGLPAGSGPAVAEVVGSGWSFRHRTDGNGVVIRIEGKAPGDEACGLLIERIRRCLEEI
ncbi:ParB/RepB/Spo0J family partition protein [Tropicimonas sp.]|uniref:ParB/RepB/Spo0J family partition protein n=1 Tax=Tropicimonas sp. TaxID=2067044 RepID=UPI003A86DC90